MASTTNFVLYQIGWFACVLGAASDHPDLGLTIALCLVGTHLALTTQPWMQIQLLGVALAVGLVVDTLLLNLDVYRFPTNNMISWLPPAWILVLWIQFATTFQYCLHWLGGRYFLCWLFGLVGAPIVFLGGERLGAVSFLEPRLTNLILLGVLWSLAIPSLVFASDSIHARSEAVITYRGFTTPRGGDRKISSSET